MNLEDMFAEYEWLRMLKKRKHQQKLQRKYRSIKVPVMIIETSGGVEYEESIGSIYGTTEAGNQATCSSRRETI